MDILYDPDNQDIASFNHYLDERGYVKCYVPDHPQANKGYVHGHRLVMERHVQQFGITFLDPSWVVHHINLNKIDNRYENLFLCTQTEHVSIHNRLGSSYKKKPNAKIQVA